MTILGQIIINDENIEIEAIADLSIQQDGMIDFIENIDFFILYLYRWWRGWNKINN